MNFIKVPSVRGNYIDPYDNLYRIVQGLDSGQAIASKYEVQSFPTLDEFLEANNLSPISASLTADPGDNSGGSLSRAAVLNQDLVVVGTTVGGADEGDIFPQDTAMEDVLRGILRNRVVHEYTQPSVDLEIVSPSIAEAGESVSLEIQATFQQGDAGALTALTVVDGTMLPDGATIDLVDGASKTLLTETLPPEGISATVEATYEAGPEIMDNMGSASPGAVPAGSVQATVTLYPTRHGYTLVSSSDPITPPDPESLEYIRTSFTKAATGPQPGDMLPLLIPAGSVAVAFALPKSLGDVRVIGPMSGFDVTAIFAQVDYSEGGVGAAYPEPYNLYYWNLDGPSPSDVTYEIHIPSV